MTVPPPLKPEMEKPSGPIVYTVSSGANVFPGWSLADVRVVNGELAIFNGYRKDKTVAVRIGGHDRVVTRDEWRKAPAQKY